MLSSVLTYLSDPLFFVGFSLATGAAYVVVWVISLKGITKPNNPLFVSSASQEEANGLARLVSASRNVRKGAPAVKPSRSRPRVTRTAA